MGMTSSAVTVVLAKDIRLLWRQRAAWASAATFAAVTVMTFSFAFDLVAADVRPLLPGVLWVTFLFAGIIASGQSFALEAEQGTLDAVLLAPVSRTVLYAGKAVSNLLALLAIEAVVLVMAMVLFDEPLVSLELAGITAVGTVGYVALVTLLSTMGAGTQGRAVLLPALVLPLLVPLLIAAVRATGAALGEPAGTAPWLYLLGVFSVWSAIGSALLFPLVVER